MTTRTELRPVEPLLTTKVLAKAPRTQNLIGDKILPPQDVTGGADPFAVQDAKRTGRLSGKLWVENVAESFGVGAIDLELGATDRRLKVELLSMGTHSYACQERGIETEVPGLYEAESMLPESLDVRAGRRVRNIVELRRERLIANTLFSAAWTNADIATLPVGINTPFNQTGAKPLSALKYQIEAVIDAAYGIGYDAITLVLGELEARVLLEDPQLRRYVGDASKGIASGGRDFLTWNELPTIIAANLGLRPENVHIGTARSNIAGDGVTPDIQRIWQGGIWAGVCALDGIGLDKAASGITLSAVAALQTEYRPLSIGAYNRDDGRAHSVFCDEWRGLSVVDAKLGYYLHGLIV